MADAVGIFNKKRRFWQHECPSRPRILALNSDNLIEL
jgi:hypothetical protein